MANDTAVLPKRVKKPDWLRVKLPVGKKYTELRGLVDKYKLNTICTSGSCPNMGECWGEGTATFMILGNICTRSCGFCGVKTGRPETVEWDEPEKVARSIKIMGIKHAVVTSVDRDDLKDGGSIIWAETVDAIRRANPNTTLETLIPDFQGKTSQIDRIIKVHPEVVSHNMETVRRLTREVRIQAKYDRSLGVLKYLKEKGMRTKTGLMLGLGETEEEVINKMNDNQYGLSSGVYTKDLGRGLRVSKAIRAGITFVNTYRLISPSAPFGGMKDSGYGKEAGIESIKDYTRIKTTWFNTSDKPMSDPFTMG